MSVVKGSAEIINTSGWLDVTSGGPDADGFYWLTATPKRRYWRHLSFWQMAVRTRSLMPTAKPIEGD